MTWKNQIFQKKNSKNESEIIFINSPGLKSAFGTEDEFIKTN